METEEKVDEQKEDETITVDEQESAPSEQGQDQPMVSRIIETPMEDEQRIAVGTELAELLAVIEKLEDEKKVINARFKKNIDVKTADAHLLGQKFLAAVNTEERECTVEYHWDTGIRTIHHPDTGETLQEDSISDAERQKHMPGFENQVETDSVLPCVNKDCGEAVDGHCTDSLKDTSCPDYAAPEAEEPEGELMKCANVDCEAESEGKCLSDEGSVACENYKAPVEESEVSDG